MAEDGPTFIPPQQKRSQESLERLLEAAEATFREEGYEALTIGEVVHRAGSSVGGLYRRFPNKSALLEAVRDRFYARSEATLKREFETGGGTGESLEDAVRRIVTVLARHFLEEPDLFRVFFTQALIDPDVSKGAEKANRARREAVAGALLVHRDEIRHPEPYSAASMVYTLCMAVLRERIMHGPGAELMGQFPDEILLSDLTRALTCFLKGPGV